MKNKAFILIAAIIATYPFFGSPTTKNDTVKLENLSATVTKQATTLLHNNGIEVANLPRKTAAELKTKLNLITAQLTNHLRMQHKDEIALDLVCKDLEIALSDFIENALTVVSQKVLPQAVDQFITKLAQEKPVNLAKLPQKMKDEFEQRKDNVLSLLIKDMKEDNRDYVYVSNLESTCHKKFDLFLERAKYVLISLWGQGAMATLDSLKFVTNTQPFPQQTQQKKIGGSI